MSSWYDHTSRVLSRMAETHTEPKVWAEVVGHRLLQARAYFTWAATRKRPRVLQQPFPATDHWRSSADFWQAQLGIPHDLIDWWELRLRIVEQAGKLEATYGVMRLYYHLKAMQLPLNDLVGYWFQDLHDLGHEVGRASKGRISDNPYRLRPSLKKLVPDSDRWLKETYPHLWVD